MGFGGLHVFNYGSDLLAVAQEFGPPSRMHLIRFRLKREIVLFRTPIRL